eukprot:scaffold181704_cov24-Tisochrysis_lutea.AAC.1
MSSMDVLPVSNFNTYLPVALCASGHRLPMRMPYVAMCAITAFNMWDKLLQCCTSPRYRFTVDDVDDAYTEKVSLEMLTSISQLPCVRCVGVVMSCAHCCWLVCRAGSNPTWNSLLACRTDFTGWFLA